MDLFMQRLDGMKCGVSAIALHAIRIQPNAKVTMMMVQRRWNFLFSPDAVFYCGYPCAMLGTRKEQRQVITTDRSKIAPGGIGAPCCRPFGQLARRHGTGDPVALRQFAAQLQQ